MRAGRLAYTVGMSDDLFAARIMRNTLKWYRKLLREGLTPYEAYEACNGVEIGMWKARTPEIQQAYLAKHGESMPI
jgi:hypothetical protein